MNVGAEKEMDIRGRRVKTGIFKSPVDGRRHVGVAGIDGDLRVDPRRFGAEFHAVYAYPHEHYAFWQRWLGRGPFGYGHFGENLTISGPPETEACLGDVLRVGTATLQIAQPRTPCRKLSARMGNDFSGTFLRSRKVGYYLRVVETGYVAAGDDITIVDRQPGAPTMDDFVRLAHLDYGDAPGLSTLLEARGLPEGWRSIIEERIVRTYAATGPIGSVELVVSARVQLAEDVVSYVLKSAVGRPLPPFRAGESLPLFEPRADGTLRSLGRYLLGGNPFDNDAYRIIARASAGALERSTDRAVRTVMPPFECGTRLRATAPRGTLTPDGMGTDSKAHVVILAEALGIVPFLAWLRHAVALSVTAELHLLHHDRSAMTEVLWQEAREIAAGCATTSFVHANTPPTVSTVEAIVGKLPRGSTYALIAGRRPFVECSEAAVRALGVAASRVRSETLVP